MSRQVGRPKKDPTLILNQRFSFLTNLKQFTLIEMFKDKGQSIRQIIFAIVPAMIDKFRQDKIEMDLSEAQWEIVKKVIKWGEKHA